MLQLSTVITHDSFTRNAPVSIESTDEEVHLSNIIEYNSLSHNAQRNAKVAQAALIKIYV